MNIDAQGSLFGEGRMTPPRRSSTPDPESIRGRLDRLLGILRQSETMPFSDRDARMWATVVPNMSKWLPEAEADTIRAAFNHEMERLGAKKLVAISPHRNG
ncbi:hypothetical protein [Paracoccus sp. MC1862]|uniref:hypothetical protein n=1 Tax=Paracoccus sp. MC1862 TaxID=2760307 RepID=UPI0015FFE56F|nr:hypothetical protein [Paracoccus sp. MC1862]MBB1499617.1 hypothetical protein [Paracoccus sp. MC1862]